MSTSLAVVEFGVNSLIRCSEQEIELTIVECTPMFPTLVNQWIFLQSCV